MNKNTVSIILDGKEYNLSFNFLIIKTIQSCNKNLKVEDIFNGIANQDFNIINELLYRGIKFNHEDFERKVIDNLGFGDMENVFTSIANLFDTTMPKSEHGEEGK